MTTQPTKLNDPLAARIAELALLRGTFTLRSGRTSNYYLDKYRFTTQPDVLEQLAQRFADTIKTIESESGKKTARLAGAELGGIPLVAAAGINTGLPCLFVRNAKKDYGTAKQLEGPLEPGDTVIFLEDVATSGGQAVEAVHVLRELGAEVLAVIAVIDREEGARQTVEAANLPFHALFTRTDLGIEPEGD